MGTTQAGSSQKWSTATRRAHWDLASRGPRDAARYRPRAIGALALAAVATSPVSVRRAHRARQSKPFSPRSHHNLSVLSLSVCPLWTLRLRHDNALWKGVHFHYSRPRTCYPGCLPSTSCSFLRVVSSSWVRLRYCTRLPAYTSTHGQATSLVREVISHPPHPLRERRAMSSWRSWEMRQRSEWLFRPDPHASHVLLGLSWAGQHGSYCKSLRRPPLDPCSTSLPP